jgi:hypothetical protein
MIQRLNSQSQSQSWVMMDDGVEFQQERQEQEGRDDEQCSE